MEVSAAILSPHLTSAFTAHILPHLQLLTDGLQIASSEASHHHHHWDGPQCELLVFAGNRGVGGTGAATSLDADVGGCHLTQSESHNMTSAEKMNHF